MTSSITSQLTALPNPGYLPRAPDDIIHLIFYALNLQNSALFSGTCKRFYEIYKAILPIGMGCSRIYHGLKDLGTELINKTLSRKLTDNERSFLGLVGNEFKSPKALTDHVTKVLDETLTLQNFHAKFQEILAGLKIQPSMKIDEILYQIARKRIRSPFNVLTNGQPNQSQKMKLHTVVSGFNQQALQELCKAYAHQPIAEITMESFQHQVANIMLFCQDSDKYHVEAELRQAIQTKHSPQDLKNKSAELLKNAPQDEHARKEVEKLARFYDELSEMIGYNNQELRYAALHNIN